MFKIITSVVNMASLHAASNNSVVILFASLNLAAATDPPEPLPTTMKSNSITAEI